MATTEDVEAIAAAVPDDADVHVTLSIDTLEVTIVGKSATSDPEPAVATDDGQAPVETDDTDERAETTADATPDVDPEAFDPVEVRDYSGRPLLYLGSAAARLFEESDRVHVARTDANGVEVRPGPGEEWPDYSVGDSSVQIGAGGVDVLGVSSGDEVDVRPDLERGVLTLDPLTISGRQHEFECEGCGATFDSRADRTNHRSNTKCGAELPEDISVEEFEAIVADADTVTDVKQELRSLRRKQVGALLERHDLADDVTTGHRLVHDARDDGVSLPEGLTEADVHAVAEVATSVEGAAANMEVDVERARKILRAHDCLDEVRGDGDD
ncbi:MAG: hypothetical protein ACOCSD_06990 [Halolamina sp.]